MQKLYTLNAIRYIIPSSTPKTTHTNDNILCQPFGCMWHRQIVNENRYILLNERPGAVCVKRSTLNAWRAVQYLPLGWISSFLNTNMFAVVLIFIKKKVRAYCLRSSGRRTCILVCLGMVEECVCLRRWTCILAAYGTRGVVVQCVCVIKFSLIIPPMSLSIYVIFWKSMSWVSGIVHN